MSTSIAADLRLSSDELQILGEIIYAIPLDDKKASFTAAFRAYEQVIRLRGLTASSDERYYRCLLKLVHLDGSTWREKFNKLQGILRTNLVTQHQSRLPSVTREEPVRPSTPKFSLHRRAKSNVQLATLNRDVSRAVIERTHVRSDGNMSFTVHERAQDLISNARRVHASRGAKLMKRLFAKWHKKTVRQVSVRREVDLYQHAVRYDRLTLRSQAFSIWHEKYRYYAVFDQKAAQARKLLLIERCFKHWSAATMSRHQRRYQDNLATEQVALLGTVSKKKKTSVAHKYFGLWRAKLYKIRNTELSALAYRRRTVLASNWRSWHFRLLEVRYYESNTMVIASEHLVRWQSRLMLKQDQLRKAYHLYLGSLLKRYMHSLSDGVVHQEKLRCQALAVSNSHTLQRAFAFWRHVYILARRHEQVQILGEQRLKQAALDQWLVCIRNRLVARAFASRLRLKALFQSWHLNSRASSLQALFDSHRLHKTFSFWLVEGRGLLLRRIRLRRILQSSLRVMQAKFSVMSERLSDSEMTLLELRDAKLQVATIAHWRSRLWAVDETFDQADRMYHLKLQKHAVVLMRSFVAQQVFQMSRAHQIEMYYVLKQRFRLWRQSVFNKQELDREDKLSAVLSMQGTRDVRVFFDIWRNRKVRLTMMHTTSSERVYSRNMIQLRKTFALWIERSSRYARILEVATHLDETRLRNMFFGFWVSDRLRVDTLLHRANSILSRKVDSTIRTAFRRWKLKSMHMQALAHQADLYERDVDLRLTRNALYILLETVRARRGFDPESMEEEKDQDTSQSQSLENIIDSTSYLTRW